MARRAVPKPDRGTYDLAHAHLLDRHLWSWQLVLNGTDSRPQGWYLSVRQGHEEGPLTRSQMAARLRALPDASEWAVAAVCVEWLSATTDVDRLVNLAVA